MEKEAVLKFADMVDELAKINPDYGRKLFFTTPENLKNKILNDIDRVEEIDKIMPNVDRSTKGKLSREKGLILEEIAGQILNIRNVYTKHDRVLCDSNEIDLVMQPSTNNCIYERFLPKYMREDFLVECKNHKKPIDVTLVGKFYSLVMYKSAKLGIMFTNQPLTGEHEWDAAIGLTKKLNLKSKVIIINVTISEIKNILQNNGVFIDLISEKVNKIIYHTDFRSNISMHPAEKLMIN